MLADVLMDFRLGARKLAASPGFSAIVVFMLALGIAVNTTMFSVVNAVFFQPIHARNPDQLVAVYTSVSREAPYRSSSYLDYQDVKDRGEGVITNLAAYTLAPADLKLGARTQHITAGIVSANYLQLMGARTILGRSFARDEDNAGNPRLDVVVTARLWHELLGADPNIIGKVIHLNRQTLTVVGVVDDKYARLRRFFEVDLFVPAAAKDVVFDQHTLASREARQFFLLGRIPPHQSIAKAQARMQSVAAELHSQYPGIWSDEQGHPGTITVIPEWQSRVPPQARWGMAAFSAFLLAMVAAVLLIVCANLAGLNLARALGREREIAVRMALGSSRGRLVRQLLAESLLLSTAGALLSLALTFAAVRLIAAYRPPLEVSIGLDLGIDAHVLWFGLLITLLTTMLFGLAPALHATRPDLVPALRGTMAQGASGRFALRNTLIIAEIMLSVVLLVPTGLFLRSLVNFENLDLGFRRDHLALVSVTLDEPRYSADRGLRATADILEKLRQLPQVMKADVGLVVPLTGVSSTERFQELGSAENPRAIDTNVVGPSYFETLEIPLLTGRRFDQAKGEGEVAIINEAYARTLWKSQNPIGKRITSPDEPGKTIEVIGVVGTGKYDSVAEGPTPMVYRPLDQHYSPTLVFHVRTRTQPQAALIPVVRAIQAYDASLAVFDAKTMDEALAVSVAPYRMLGDTLLVFGGFAVVLAFSGLYSLVAFQTSRRKLEIGIRAALGARPTGILRLLARQGMKLVMTGILLGIPASIGLSMLIGSFLFGVAPLDPWTYLAMLAVICLTAGSAIVIPAWSAMKSEPADALRAL